MLVPEKSITIPIWVINLKRSVERRKTIEENLQNLGLTYEIIEAVDGHALSKDAIDKIIETSKKSPFYELAYSVKGGRPAKKGEIGCSMSHIKCWERMVKEDIKEVLILEDDIILTEDFVELLKHRSDFPTHWDRINFMTDVDHIPFGNPIYKNYCLSKFCNFDFDNRTSCYFITRKGAEKLLKYDIFGYFPVDAYTGRDYLTGCASGSIYPLPVQLRNIESDISIDPTEKNIIVIVKNFLKRKSRGLYYRIKTFIVKNIPRYKRHLLDDRYQLFLLKQKAEEDIKRILSKS